MRKRYELMAIGLLAAAVSAAPVAAYYSGPLARTAVKRPAKATPSRRGRPRKFAGPSRAVTLTLPHDTIATLHAIHHDLSRAVVAAVQTMDPPPTNRQAQLATFGDSAVIVVPNNRALSERTGIELVPIPDDRALLSFDDRITVPQLELRVIDALGDGTLADGDRELFEQLAEILRQARRAGGVELQQRSVLVMRNDGGLEAVDSQPEAERRRA